MADLSVEQGTGCERNLGGCAAATCGLSLGGKRNLGLWRFGKCESFRIGAVTYAL
jgi:hypothetical protein